MVTPDFQLHRAVVNHILLPPNVPGAIDRDLHQVNLKLLARLKEACEEVRLMVKDTYSRELEHLSRSLHHCRLIHASHYLDSRQLEDAFQALKDGEVLIIHVVEQNAGVLIRREAREPGGRIIFEAFEASPRSADVLQATASLQWDFPTSAAAIPVCVFEDRAFQRRLADFLGKASIETIKEFGAVSRKAKSNTYEPRDTTNPAMITSLLISLLEGIGEQVTVSPIRKRVRDEVRWKDSLIPWRRSPFWLLLRVGVLRNLLILTTPEVAQAMYKTLMCTVHASLLRDTVGSLSPEISHLAFTKLCRRLQKLEQDSTVAAKGSELANAYSILLGSTRLKFSQDTDDATRALHSAWECYKRKIRRSVIPMRIRQAPPMTLKLSLTNSNMYFAQLSSPLSKNVDMDVYAMPPTLVNFFSHYSKLTEIESQEAVRPSRVQPDSTICHQTLTELSGRIQGYLSASTNRYEVGTEDRSCMILTIMWMWMAADKCLNRLFPALYHFKPVFHPSTLDCLRLSRQRDLARLSQMQEYLHDRHSTAESSGDRTMFDNPTYGCFAEKYYDYLSSDSEMHELLQQIQLQTESAIQQKHTEWTKLDLDHELLMREISAMTCQYTLVGEFMVPHHAENCGKCALTRKAERIRIERIEKPLPYNLGEAKAVLFELLCPESIAVYRDATWRIAVMLGLPELHPAVKEPLTMVQDYYYGFEQVTAEGGLGEVATAKPIRPIITLGSRSKSFLQTHFQYVHFPIPFDKVCVNNGLKFEFYDPISKSWPAEHLKHITFSHHCVIPILRNSPFAAIEFPSRLISVTESRRDLSNVLTANANISSNEILARQPSCPQSLGIQEFTAFQGLICGYHSFWPTLLVELGASNLNFSSEAVMLLIESLCARTGPEQAGSLHAADIFFQDVSFCSALASQISLRLKAISSNWRENYCMEILITLMLKLLELGSASVRAKTLSLLDLAQEATIKWTRVLRKEYWSTKDVSTSRRISQLILWAALLCKRTFARWHNSMVTFDQSSCIPESALSVFVEASISLNDNLAEDPAALPPIIRSIVIRDLKTVYNLQNLILYSLERSPRALAVGAAQADIISNRPFNYSSLEVRKKADGLWAEVKLEADEHMEAQNVQFHLLAGTLLVDGKTVQKELPLKYRNSEAIRQILPFQRLKVNPSSLYGMTYKLGFPIEGHEIHLGFRRDILIIRAYVTGVLLELIPTTIYANNDSFDLPASLVENCVHWLNLREKVVEVRRQPVIWKSLGNIWRINLSTKTAHRWRGTTKLIDCHSTLFHHIACMFRGFEDRRHVLVYQPREGALLIALPRYALSFFVNANGLLESQELGAEIDQNQDAGVWYGLSAKIVLRDIHNPQKRSVIVPLGFTNLQRKGIHVEVEVQSPNADYGRYFLDEVLGRVTCAMEPRLFYTKAMFHALTSFCLPDPLTGKTGVDEACHILKSGGCQPYTPLTDVNIHILDSIAGLTPVRHFYPPDLRVLESVSWNTVLTVGMQDERFWPLVDCIKAKSSLLAKFELNEQIDCQIPVSGVSEATELRMRDEHLLLRGQNRRSLFQRCQIMSNTPQNGVNDMIYIPRGYNDFAKHHKHVFEAARVLQQWPTRLPSPPALLLLMQQWPHIGGFGDGTLVYDKMRLSDQLDTDVASSWGSLVNLYRLSGKDAKYMLLFLTATICFRKDISMFAVQTLIAFAVLPELKVIDLPSWPHYTQWRPKFTPNANYIKALLSACGREFVTDDRAVTQRQVRATNATRKIHDAQVKDKIEAVASSLCEQWPCPQPSLDGFSTSLIDHEKALSLIGPEWHAMFQNHEFEQHLRQVQAILDKWRTTAPTRDIKSCEQELKLVVPRGAQHLYSSMLHINIAMHEQVGSEGSHVNNSHRMTASSRQQKSYRDTNELRQILAELPKSRSIVRTEYVRGLRQSIFALEKRRNTEVTKNQPLELSQMTLHVEVSRIKVDQCFSYITNALKKGAPGSDWLERSGLWPFPRVCSLLAMLSSSISIEMDASVKSAIIHLGILVTRWQRLLRVQDASRQRKFQLLQDELDNPGHLNWSPVDYPDWLLLEIDANILVRQIQAEVAFATIRGASGSNSVLQLNMGQGKTSIIIPLVASALANGKSLCRVVIPKALLLQTAQLLQSRLGGLLQREVRHVPFSRRTPCTRETIETYVNVHKDMLKKSGVIVALPEHLMSFMLSGPQRLSDNRVAEATCMIRFQNWLEKNCRDVLDECDFTMAVKTQLIYPSGSQATVDGARYRWETVEAMLQLAESHLHDLKRRYSSSVQVVTRQQGGFPFIYFLRNDAQEALMQQVVWDICNGKTSVLRMEGFSVFERQAIKIFMSIARPQKNVTECIANIHRGNPSAGFVIYLVRGLIVHRILLLCLSRRWNVQYGLHPARDPVAVPFHAKGIPSNLAEWGHVDVSLLFTCLSFYYQGLSQEQLRKSLEQILKSDDPAREFEEWIHGSEDLCGQYRDWTSINLDDTSQLENIWNNVRFNVAAIDYFLNNFVFPKHAKQFKVKLQASGWDLPLRGVGENITTGFSGTNDNRLVLPLTIRQEDLPGLAHTNAEVLTYLLDPRNRGYSLLGRRDWDNNGKLLFRRFSEEEFLSKLKSKNIRILIDSGAAILEMTNQALAKKWLEIDSSAPAAIYFDETNRAMVAYRGRRSLPLLASPFAENLGDCLVYLDESHTRGTDLKFPPAAHGAVTLSLGQTKDQTVQAVMRLRQLATTQAVTFFAPPEVHQSIIDFRKKTAYEHIDSHDAVCWLLEQTIQGLENLQPLFYAQGSDYCRRAQAKVDYPDFLSRDDHRASYLKVLQDPEQQTLRSLYDVRSRRSGRRPHIQTQSTDPKLADFGKELERHRKAFQDTGNAVHASALQEVEQEREVAVEAETIRERQKPLHFYPQSFAGLHDDIQAFVRTGNLRTGSMICQHVFAFLRHTSIGQKYALKLPTESNLFVSSEFQKTVFTPSGKHNDDFLRPVQWILWSATSEIAILVSSEEADLLIPLCRSATKQLVHLITYAAPITRKMLQFNDMTYFAIPSLPVGWMSPLWLKVQVGLFAGRLYFPFNELAYVKDFLELTDDATINHSPFELEEMKELIVDSSADTSDDQEEDGLDPQNGMLPTKQTRAQLAKVKLLSFLHEWLAIRGKGQDFAQTPMGYVCSGKALTEDHPFFRTVDSETRQHAQGVSEENMASIEGSCAVQDDTESDIDGDDLHERQKLTEEELRRVQALEDGGEMFVDAEEYLNNDDENGASSEDGHE